MPQPSNGIRAQETHVIAATQELQPHCVADVKVYISSHSQMWRSVFLYKRCTIYESLGGWLLPLSL